MECHRLEAAKRTLDLTSSGISWRTPRSLRSSSSPLRTAGLRERKGLRGWLFVGRRFLAPRGVFRTVVTTRVTRVSRSDREAHAQQSRGCHDARRGSHGSSTADDDVSPTDDGDERTLPRTAAGNRTNDAPRTKDVEDNGENKRIYLSLIRRGNIAIAVV